MPIIPPVRSKLFMPRRSPLIGLLIGVIVFASFGAWYSMPYLQAKGILGPGSAATVKSSSGTTLKATTLASATGLTTSQTACPAKGTARAAILPPLLGAQEKHQDVVYVSNHNYRTGPSGVLVRYDAENGKQITITALPDVQISNAQVSADGQWILFLSQLAQNQNNYYKIQMVRIDGKDLQTLYCTDLRVANISLSPFSYNASNYVVFDTNDMKRINTIYQLNLNTGSMQQELQGQQSYDVIGWRAPDSVYLHEGLTQRNVTQNQRNVYLLNLSAGNKPGNNLHLFSTSSRCDDFSPDGEDGFSLYTSSCVGWGGYRICELANCPATSGPSTISVWNFDDKTQQYQKKQISSTDDLMAVVQIHVVSSHTLLAFVGHSGTGANTAKNGVWKLDINTKKWQMLVSNTLPGASFMLNVGSQQIWSNVSRDGQKYAVRAASPQSLGYDALYMGAMDGRGMLKFASSVDGAQLLLAGWTTI